MMTTLRFLAMLFVLAICHAADTKDEDDTTHHEGEEEIEPAYAVLFPPFALTIGVVAFYILSRYIKALPYTAVMFLIGIMMGIGSTLGAEKSNHINQSLELWIPINSEVLLLVFLPGLIFKDSMGQSVHLFAFAIWQLLIFAFPMVLAGMTLTALIGYYIFPYGWSFDLAMTFGSILAATDPVAVAALLEEVGAPPRLKIHVAGESLLNDGSAIVFFTIFSERFFHELGFDDIGEEIDLKKGVALFCRKALGGVAVGWAFGWLLILVLFMLDRRFSREENVVQVTAVIGLVYLNYYVADFVFQTSGVIATVAAGLQVKLIGHAMINDSKLLEDFMSIIEHILNTILFMLGGVLWGGGIVEGEQSGLWGAKDWGYMILLYVLLQVIRFVLFFGVYPITSRIGLKTSLQETIFQVYGGLRGAVGIALAIALDNEVERAAVENQQEREEEKQTTQVFIMVGGIAFLTLVINGTTAGPLLKWLGLADSSDSRKKIVDAYKVHFRADAIEDFVRLLAQKRFQNVNFALMKAHVPYIADLTRTQLFEAIEKHKEKTPNDDYTPPFLSGILPYLPEDKTVRKFVRDQGSTVDILLEDIQKESGERERKMRFAQRSKYRKIRRVSTNVRFMMGDEPLSAVELRVLFVSLLRSAYNDQIRHGELADNHLLSVSLLQALEFAQDSCSRGKPLKDWTYLVSTESKIMNASKKVRSNKIISACLNHLWFRRSGLGLKEKAHTVLIERSLAVMSAHQSAQHFFQAEFQNDESELSEAGKLVIQESQLQYKMAETALQEIDQDLVELTVSHKLCKILLTMGISHIEKLKATGLVKESEAEHFVEEIEEYLDEIMTCQDKHDQNPEEAREDCSLCEHDERTHNI